MREIDQRICELLRVRKMEGMELLFKEYYKPLVVWGATFVSDVQRSEDIVQDFFVKLWEKSLTDKLFPDSLKSYLFTSVRNLALNQLDRLDPLKQACDVAYYERPWEEYDNFLYLNPGSVSIPKENSKHGYMIYEDTTFLWKTLEGDVYHSL